MTAMNRMPGGYKQSEVGVIPEDWACRTLQSLTDLARPIGYGIVQTGKAMHNGVKCLRVVDMVDGRIDPEQLITTSDAISLAYKRTLLRKNDLVIALRGKIGAVAVIGEELAGANLTRGVALLSASEDFHSGYLSQYLSSSTGKNTIEKNLNGSALQEIPIAALRKIPVVVPPLPEQRAIATALSDVDALLAAQDKLIAKKRDIKQAAMQQLLTGKQRLPGFGGCGLKNSEIGQIPCDWQMVEIGKIASVKTGPFGSSLHERDYVDDGTPIITVEHLGERGVMHNSLPMVSNVDRKRLSAYSLEEGDIVFSRVGSVDRNARISCGEQGWLFSGRLLRLRRIERSIDTQFLSYQFHFEPFKQRVRTVAVGQTMASLNTQILKGVLIVLPPPEEQTAIASVLSDMDADLAALEQQRDKIRALKQGMMQELLTGRIRLV